MVFYDLVHQVVWWLYFVFGEPRWGEIRISLILRDRLWDECVSLW